MYECYFLKSFLLIPAITYISLYPAWLLQVLYYNKIALKHCYKKLIIKTLDKYSFIEYNINYSIYTGLFTVFILVHLQ